jgi:hypothetical protein
MKYEIIISIDVEVLSMWRLGWYGDHATSSTNGDGGLRFFFS